MEEKMPESPDSSESAENRKIDPDETSQKRFFLNFLIL